MPATARATTSHFSGPRSTARGSSVPFLAPINLHSHIRSVFWANSGLGVVTLTDFWPKLHSGNVRIVRQNLGSRISGKKLELESGGTIESDFFVMCTGWGDHFAMFDEALKRDIGLPLFRKMLSPPTTTTAANDDDDDDDDRRWASLDAAADLAVNQKLPFIASPPGLKNSHTNARQPHRRWRLYRRVVPLAHAARGERSLAILGQIHTVQTPLLAEVQSFWAILYLLGELELPRDMSVMEQEVAEWNAWTRKRYLSQGQKFPYSLYDFLPVSTALWACCSVMLMAVAVCRHAVQGPRDQFAKEERFLG